MHSQFSEQNELKWLTLKQIPPIYQKYHHQYIKQFNNSKNANAATTLHVKESYFTEIFAWLSSLNLYVYDATAKE